MPLQLPTSGTVTIKYFVVIGYPIGGWYGPMTQTLTVGGGSSSGPSEFVPHFPRPPAALTSAPCHRFWSRHSPISAVLSARLHPGRAAVASAGFQERRRRQLRLRSLRRARRSGRGGPDRLLSRALREQNKTAPRFISLRLISQFVEYRLVETNGNSCACSSSFARAWPQGGAAGDHRPRTAPAQAGCHKTKRSGAGRFPR